jgi:hypothetical protein
MQGAATKMMRDIIEEPQRSQMAPCRRNPLGGSRDFYRGRDDGYPPPPAQIRTCATNAYGSYLG